MKLGEWLTPAAGVIATMLVWITLPWTPFAHAARARTRTTTEHARVSPVVAARSRSVRLDAVQSRWERTLPDTTVILDLKRQRVQNGWSFEVQHRMTSATPPCPVPPGDCVEEPAFSHTTGWYSVQLPGEIVLHPAGADDVVLTFQLMTQSELDEARLSSTIPPGAMVLQRRLANGTRNYLWLRGRLP